VNLNFRDFNFHYTLNYRSCSDVFGTKKQEGASFSSSHRVFRSFSSFRMLRFLFQVALVSSWGASSFVSECFVFAASIPAVAFCLHICVNPCDLSTFVLFWRFRLFLSALSLYCGFIYSQFVLHVLRN